METAATWRELLGTLIKKSDERQRLASTLDVSIITLRRWVNGTSNPRFSNLQGLYDALPEQATCLLPLMQAEFPDFVPAFKDNAALDPVLNGISSTFYASFFKEYTIVSKRQKFWQLCTMILRNALAQLDPELQGMAIMVVQCMSPSIGCKVRSSYIRAGLGNDPWPNHLEIHASFLGAESLSGHVIASGRPVVVQSRSQQGPLPVRWGEMEKSVAAYPLLLSGRVAGCLTCSSTQTEYFLPARMMLLQQYADLMMLVLDPCEFYAFEYIDLHFMPGYHEQIRHLSNFRLRVIDAIQQASKNQQPITLSEATQLVWRRVEEEFLSMGGNREGEDAQVLGSASK